MRILLDKSFMRLLQNKRVFLDYKPRFVDVSLFTVFFNKMHILYFKHSITILLLDHPVCNFQSLFCIEQALQKAQNYWNWSPTSTAILYFVSRKFARKSNFLLSPYFVTVFFHSNEHFLFLKSDNYTIALPFCMRFVGRIAR